MYFYFGIKQYNGNIFAYRIYFDQLSLKVKDYYSYEFVVVTENYNEFVKRNNFMNLGVFTSFQKFYLAYIQSCERVVQDLVDKKDYVNKWYCTQKQSEISGNTEIELVQYCYIQNIRVQYRNNRFVYISTTQDIILRKRKEENYNNMTDIEIKYNPYNEHIVDDILDNSANVWDNNEKNVKQLKSIIINRVNNYFENIL